MKEQLFTLDTLLTLDPSYFEIVDQELETITNIELELSLVSEE